jgi:hypothetical protein
MRFRLVIGFIELLQIVTISNYSAITNSHTHTRARACTLSLSTACIESSQSAVSSLAV